MANELERLFTRFLDAPRANPERGPDEFTAFLLELDRAGKLKTFSEAEWIETGRKFGLSDAEIVGWIEQAAGMIGKPEGGLEPAAWTGLQRSNPLTWQTSDGYTLYYVGGEWVDNLDPDLVDLTFYGDESGPIGSDGEILSGGFIR